MTGTLLAWADRSSPGSCAPPPKPESASVHGEVLFAQQLVCARLDSTDSNNFWLILPAINRSDSW